MNVDTGNSNSSNLDNIEKFRNRDALREGIVFLQNNEADKAEYLARNYKGRDNETLGKKYEEAHKKNEEFPAVAYLLVLPILYKMYLQHKENVAEAAINDKKKEYEDFLKDVVENGKNTPENIKQELDVYSKEQFREMSKKIIEKQKNLFSQKMDDLSIDEIEKVTNNIQTQLSTGKEIDMKALANCLSDKPTQTAQVNGQTKPNSDLIRQNQAQQRQDKIIKLDAKTDQNILQAFRNTKKDQEINVSNLGSQFQGLTVGETIKIQPNAGISRIASVKDKNTLIMID